MGWTFLTYFPPFFASMNSTEQMVSVQLSNSNTLVILQQELYLEVPREMKSEKTWFIKGMDIKSSINAAAGPGKSTKPDNVFYLDLSSAVRW